MTAAAFLFNPPEGGLTQLGDRTGGSFVFHFRSPLVFHSVRRRGIRRFRFSWPTRAHFRVTPSRIWRHLRWFYVCYYARHCDQCSTFNPWPRMMEIVTPTVILATACGLEPVARPTRKDLLTSLTPEISFSVWIRSFFGPPHWCFYWHHWSPSWTRTRYVRRVKPQEGSGHLALISFLIHLRVEDLVFRVHWSLFWWGA